MQSNQPGLPWPDHAERTPPEQRTGGNFEVSFSRTRGELSDTMDRMGVDSWQLHTISGSQSDPGVVVTWEDEHGPHAVADDQHTSKKANLRNVYLWLRDQRMCDDRDVVTGGQDAMAAAALPSGDEGDSVLSRPAHEVLGIAKNSADEVVEARFRQLAKEGHGDHGGDLDMAKLKAARDRMVGDDD